MITTSAARAAFLDFFAKNGHENVPSSALVPHNDPTLMFTAAGMVQFKNVFTGTEKRKYTRATSSQKCVRAGGKHNDLDNVGYTARHHTFFEMLGNFSFGDYFKEGAIPLAWELLTKEFGLPAEKLCITVYHNDDEAFDLWKKLTGFPDHKIIRINSMDNFWSAGDTGPCGPCSEIFFDHGDHIPGGPPGSADADGDRFVEIWNLVFMQFDQIDKDTRINLPKPSIDTGMGLERLSAVLQGVHDNYDTDLFKALIGDIASIAAARGAKNPEARLARVAYRVIADHLRATCFLLADGVLPSNEGRGYVLRRIMRRAMRYAHQLGCTEPLMYKLVPSLIKQMGEHFGELARAQALITETLKLEETRFKQMLDRGLKLLDDESGKLGDKGTLAGDIAFKLYDTYGFPLDLTQDILRGQDKTVDTQGFAASMQEQKARARAAWTGSGEKATSRIWFETKEKVGATEFLGYNADTAEAQLVAIVKNGESVTSAAEGDEVYLIFNQTPFYGESGGQTGDTGIVTSGGKTVAEITDTSKPVEDLPIHKARLKAAMKVDDKITLAIDVVRRNRIRANHSATHLLHAALRNRLGEHVTQKGSLVAEDKLRFDISHNKPVTREEIALIEQDVNRMIWQNTPVTTRLMTPDEAIKAGAMALFGEKYGDEVRVLSMGQDGDATYSTELCGGTHVHATGDIGLIKITSESAVAAGVRRIEAVTQSGAFAYLTGQDNTLRDIAQDLKTPPAEVAGKIIAMQNERKKLEKDLADAKKTLALGGSGSSEKETVEKIGNTSFTMMQKSFGDLDPKALREITVNYLSKSDVVITSSSSGALGIAVSAKVLPTIGSSVIYSQILQPIVGGKGGGRPEMTQAGGIDVNKLPEGMESVRTYLISKLKD